MRRRLSPRRSMTMKRSEPLRSTHVATSPVPRRQVVLPPRDLVESATVQSSVSKESVAYCLLSCRPTVVFCLASCLVSSCLVTLVLPALSVCPACFVLTYYDLTCFVMPGHVI